MWIGSDQERQGKKKEKEKRTSIKLCILPLIALIEHFDLANSYVFLFLF